MICIFYDFFISGFYCWSAIKLLDSSDYSVTYFSLLCDSIVHALMLEYSRFYGHERLRLAVN